MTALVEPGLYPELQAFGATDISACFNCGTCTAICPLSEHDATFPRRIIRYAQVGMKDALLSSKELWSCYYCGECSESCPTQAGPSEFMAAARRYAIASYDRTRLARTMYLRPVVGSLIAVFLAAFFAAFMYASHGQQSSTSLALFDFIPYELIHMLGLVVMILVFLAGLAGVVTMARHIARAEGVGLRSTLGGRAALRRSAAALWSAIGVESLGQRRYREECETDAAPLPWFHRRWFIHAATMWGFLDSIPPPELFPLRRRTFEGLANPAHHYGALRALVDSVPEATLRMTPDQVHYGQADAVHAARQETLEHAFRAGERGLDRRRLDAALKRFLSHAVEKGGERGRTGIDFGRRRRRSGRERDEQLGRATQRPHVEGGHPQF